MLESRNRRLPRRDHARVLIALALGAGATVGLGVLGSACGSSDSEATGASGQATTGALAGGTNAGGATGTGTESGGAGGVGGAGGATTGTGGYTPGACPSPCAGKIYECGDCVDNDNDTLVDAYDPDCLGACDNTEDSYYPNLPGASGGPCKADCFWDNGNGSGNDDCYWDHKCDPLEIAPDYPPEGIDCAYDENAGAGTMTCDEAFTQQSAMCLDYCGPLAPNGCDCFGCCELPAGGGEFVWLGSEEDGVGTCTIDVVGDKTKCKPCTFVPGCGNPCGTCEICIGKPTLPPECTPDGGTPDGGDPDGGIPQQCSNGVQPCGVPGQDPCAAGFFCITGCCIDLPE